jgi:hypothetical protein
MNGITHLFSKEKKLFTVGDQTQMAGFVDLTSLKTSELFWLLTSMLKYSFSYDGRTFFWWLSSIKLISCHPVHFTYNIKLNMHFRTILISMKFLYSLASLLMASSLKLLTNRWQTWGSKVALSLGSNINPFVSKPELLQLVTTGIP